jgi:hypothetical protein
MFLVVQIATTCWLVPRRAQRQKGPLGHEIGRMACGLEDRTPGISGKVALAARRTNDLNL